ncbi:hypothetical protein CF326_g6059 [Tilletia indica]|nr:hypothetical protein CF326_g6059 [Tilletia indica]
MDEFADAHKELGAAVRRYATATAAINVRPDWPALVEDFCAQRSHTTSAAATGDVLHLNGPTPASEAPPGGSNSPPRSSSSPQFECVLLPETSRLHSTTSSPTTVVSSRDMQVRLASTQPSPPKSTLSHAPSRAPAHGKKRHTPKHVPTDSAYSPGNGNKKGQCTVCNRGWTSRYWHYTVAGVPVPKMCTACYQRAVRQTQTAKVSVLPSQLS